MRKTTPTLLALLVPLLLTPPSAATGPAHLFIYIEPIAASAGDAVAFKAVSSGNASGAHSRLALHAQYRWLCVTSEGEWHEAIYAEVDWEGFEVSGDLEWDEKERLYVEALEQANRAFQQPVSVESPSPELARLLENCSRATWKAIESDLDPHVGQGRATWSPSRFCLDGRCVNQAVPQRTIGGIGNSGGERQVEALFVLGRIALFNNVHGFDPEGPTVGAHFNIDSPACDRCIYDILVEAYGVSIIPTSLANP